MMAGAFVGVVGVLPYALTLLDRLPGSVEAILPPWWLLVPLQVVQAMVLLATAATALRLWFGSKVGLGDPMLHGLVRGDPAARSDLARRTTWPVRRGWSSSAISSSSTGCTCGCGTAA
jgi:hypothetical protein